MSEEGAVNGYANPVPATIGTDEVPRWFPLCHSHVE